MTNRRCCKISISHRQQWTRRPVQVGGNFRREWETEQRDNRSGPNLKPHGPRWPALCPLCPGPPRTSERVYTLRVYYNHLLQEKQALSFEPAAKKKPLLPPSRSERDIQIVSLPQPQNPSSRLVRERWVRKMTGDKLRGRKGSYFLWTKWKAWECGSLSSCFSNKDQVCDILKRGPGLLSAGRRKKTACVAVCSKSEIFYEAFSFFFFLSRIS